MDSQIKHLCGRSLLLATERDIINRSPRLAERKEYPTNGSTFGKHGCNVLERTPNILERRKEYKSYYHNI